MRKSTTQKGFTLVELAIVMTIIGLLIGGILKGQELMQNARATATIARVRAFESAVTTFRDTYSSVPGDMIRADQRLPGCPAGPTSACNPDPTAGLAGNNIVGGLTWANAGTWANQFQALGASNAGVNAETTLFWMHLLLADLVTGVSTEPITTAVPNATINVTHPAAPIGGAFIAGYGQGGVAGRQPASAALTGQNNPPNGMLLVMTLSPGAALSTATGTLPLTATRSAVIDRKMDDGRPASGSVQAYGFTASCFTAAAAATAAYLESSTGNDCGLIFRIQG